ncbi:MAG TPA: type II toxin-antitoxin system prevent-host-death family antitoxin [Roseiarcus sp.]|nr:type II toxin-antitoxin system prevent-host-death family antitoxin [Roseiarcus sp.]
MQTFSSLELQQRSGDVQRAAAQAPVLLTSHGKPRSVILSTEEFARLKRAADEPVPPEVMPRARTVRGTEDPLGYDTTDQNAAIARMLNDVRTGRTKPAVKEELMRVRAAWEGKRP